jgi:hypothetical protein
LLEGLLRVRGGESVAEVSRMVRTTAAKLSEVAASRTPIAEILGISSRNLMETDFQRQRQMLGQLLLGKCAELAFEDIYRQEIDTEDFDLVDLREGRSDTDYRLVNGQGRYLYRINIKYFGSIFRRAADLVGLDPSDCFPLATYKIAGALEKQETEHLPYVFAIVGVPDLTPKHVGELFSNRTIENVTLIRKAPKVSNKRNVEDWAVEYAVASRSEAFETVYARIRAAQWYMLSARKADRLLREKLFERVYALKIPGFAQQFRGAELDMHFSLSGDLVLLESFLKDLREKGQNVITSMLERGSL